MLTDLELVYFKCFENLKLPLSALTLLSGGNSSGKSSTLQALALLHQTIRDHEWSTRLLLNGSATRLGTLGDVIDKVHGRYSCEIGISTDDGDSYRWLFTGTDRMEMSIPVARVTASGVTAEDPDTLHHLVPPTGSDSTAALISLRRLTYLSAERVGPQDVYLLEDSTIEPVVGRRGESAVSVLYTGRDEPVIEALQLGTPPTRLHQVQETMRRFFPGFSLAFEPIVQASAVSLGLRTSDDADVHRPTNVGFGLTQVLPIVVAALSAKQGDLLLLENPEVHLHPAGQAQMGQFLAQVAHAGVQVIVETHSDHVLNGIRRATREHAIHPNEVSLHFFRPPTETGPQVISPALDDAGNIDVWPNGFFDQFDRDANYFADWSG